MNTINTESKHMPKSTNTAASSLAVIFPPGSLRYVIAQALAERALTIEALTKAARETFAEAAANEVLFGVRALASAGLARLHNAHWQLTVTGVNYWSRQHKAAEQAANDAQEQASAGGTSTPQPMYRHDQLTSGGIVRIASPADRLPMVYRPGALDATALPRIEGTWRVWPDGRREPANGPSAQEVA
jgi:hypothetical protein